MALSDDLAPGTGDASAPLESNGDAATPGAAVPALAWLSVRDAAARLDVSPRTVRRRIERGELAGKSVALDGGGRAWLVSLDGDERPGDDRAAKEADSVRTANGQRERTANGQRADSAAKRSNEREIERTDSERTGRADSERTGRADSERTGRADSERTGRADSERTASEREPTRREIEQQEEIRFLRGTIEQLQRDGAEVRAALRAALKLAAPESVPQLAAPQGAKPETAPQSAPERTGAASGAVASDNGHPAPDQRTGAPETPQRATATANESGAPLSYGDIADALERDLAARGL